MLALTTLSPVPPRNVPGLIEVVQPVVDAAVRAIVRGDRALACLAVLQSWEFADGDAWEIPASLPSVDGGPSVTLAELHLRASLLRLGRAARCASEAVSGRELLPALPSLEPLGIAVTHQCRRVLAAVRQRDIFLAQHTLECPLAEQWMLEVMEGAFRRRGTASNVDAEIAWELGAANNLARIADRATLVARDALTWMSGGQPPRAAARCA
jgi:hypothetical protein